MRIGSISNNKGGVGKTTSTVNMRRLGIFKKKVLVIDIDHQAPDNLSLWFKSHNIPEIILRCLKGE